MIVKREIEMCRVVKDDKNMKVEEVREAGKEAESP